MCADYQPLLALITAHIVNDFVIQKDSWIKDRHENTLKSIRLYIHSILAGVISYLFLGMWDVVWVPIVIIITHFILDAIKSKSNDNLVYFTIDQVAHLTIITLIWLLLVPSSYGETAGHFQELYHSARFWLLASVYIAVIWPAGVIIDKFTKVWRENSGEVSTGLENAGLWIGRIERVLVLTFMLLRQFEAIGFLIAAKSVFRFGEIKKDKDRKEAEYILVGTLLSFSIAILVGTITLFVLKL